MLDDLQELRDALKLCVVSNDNRTASIAYSQSGEKYAAGSVQSDTHLLDIPSEQAALVVSTHHNDFAIHRITTITEEQEGVLVSPLILKIIIDHARRTGIPISYTIFNREGAVLFEAKDVRALCSFYQPTAKPLEKVQGSTPNINKTKWDSAEGTLKDALKRCALLGSERTFPTGDSASGYGAAVAAKSGMLYFGGQYSSFEKRNGLHAEMAVITVALMDGAIDITHVGIASTKHRDIPCTPCGCCRQFMTEIFRKYDSNPRVYCFAKENDASKEYSVEELLPDVWTSKNNHRGIVE